MENLASTYKAQEIAVWIVKLSIKASLLILFCFVFAHLWEGGPKPSDSEWVGLSFFPIGVMAGLAISLRYPIFGGIFVAASLLGFYAWHFFESARLPSGPFFILFAAPGILMLAIKLTHRMTAANKR